MKLKYELLGSRTQNEQADALDAVLTMLEHKEEIEPTTRQTR